MTEAISPTIDELVDEFLGRLRRGERPDLEDYARRHPTLAEEIRDVFPTLELMEQGKPAADCDASASFSALDRSLPFVLGDYRLVREVGRGGMGIVYEAEQLSLGRQVALKVLPPQSAQNPRHLIRFRREARSAARLHHTNIVPVYEIGEHDGVPYYAMQFIRGQSLDDVIREIVRQGELPKALTATSTDGIDRTDSSASSDRSDGFHTTETSPASPAREIYYQSVARIGAQVADALAHAHAQGILHRDVKPGNLLLDVQGTVWVSDFGLAKDDTSSLTRTGDILGTYRYMAPECFRHGADIRSDVYSLGLTLYELLLLRPAYAHRPDSPDLLAGPVRPALPRPRSMDPHIPRDLETIVLKAADLEPSRRYQSAGDLRDDVRRFLDRLPIQARRVTRAQRAWMWCRRNPRVAGLIATATTLFLLTCLGGTAAHFLREQRDRAVVAERNAKIRNHYTQAIVFRKRADAGHRVRSLREIDDALAIGPSDEMRQLLRNELIANLAHTDVFPARSWECPEAVIDVDPAFKKYARCTRDGVISVRRIADNKELLRFNRPSGVDARTQLKFSPDGRYLASFAFDHHLIVWDLTQGKQVLNDAGCAWDLSFDFTADSHRLVSGHNKEIVIYDLPTGEERSRWPTEFTPWCVSCGPDGDRVALSPEDNEPPHRLQIISCSSGTRLASLKARGWVFDIAWHPNGETIAFGCGDGNIYFWHVGSPKPFQRSETPLGTMGIFVAYSHDGSLLASSGWSQSLMLWDPQTGVALSTARNVPQRARFGPDDRQLAWFRDGPRIGIYDVYRSNVFRYVLRADRAAGIVWLDGAFSPDGRLLAIATLRGLSLWDFATGRELAFAPVGPIHLKFESSGNLLTKSNTVSRWPIRADPKKPGKAIVGPPVALPIETPHEFDISRDGTLLAVAANNGATLARVRRRDALLRLGPHEDCRYVAVNGNGRWIATGSHFGSKVKVWDSTTGGLVATLPIETTSLVRFSPDDRWLATSGGGVRLWRSGTWEEVPVVEGRFCTFSPDSRTIAVDTGYGSLRLAAISSAREYAELEPPKAFAPVQSLFTPDGTSLLGFGCHTLGYAWDLRRIREELSARGLDWDLPPFPPADRSSTASLPPFTEVELISPGHDPTVPEEMPP